ncbi:MAG: GNAT family N-acetyltransferase [Bryobacterales bacterium]|nr:GNAT family N-acetyltransferase [Bryobacterales bacterium]
MGEPFSIRGANVADVELILEMIREMATAEQRQNTVTITRAALERHVFGARPIAEVFLGFWEGEPVAYLMVQMRFSSYAGDPILYVEDVFVRARAQGRGLGKKLMAYAADLGGQRGCGAMHWSVGDWNTPALVFYDRLSGVREKGRVHYELQGAALTALARETPR